MANDCLEELMGDPKDIHKSAENRICKFPNCKTWLSIYNPNRYCFFHTRRKLIADNESKKCSSMHWKRPSVYGQKCEVAK